MAQSPHLQLVASSQELQLCDDLSAVVSQLRVRFHGNYDLLMQRLQQGESLELELPAALPEETTTPLSRDQQHQRLNDLLKQL